MITPPFHMAFPVDDLEAARGFYGGVLGCQVGRSAERWVDFEFFGHQLSAHLADMSTVDTNPVDGDAVPVRHFGVVLAWYDWEALARRLQDAGVSFLIEPRVRFAGGPGEQGTFFIQDPAGNALEFKAFRDMADIFATS